ncbi:MAG: hypothetical protein C4547_14325 [Phycisphaerales bacterium]|nr:MAG: hypothetical protein C4547_14325 [Phycisphaerales bacterium]
MSRVLIIHPERGPRHFVEARAGRHHDVCAVKSVADGLRAIAKFKPNLIIAQLCARRPEALDLLRYIRRNGNRVPTLLVGEPSAAVLEPAAAKLGAAGFVEYPVEQETLDVAISLALQAEWDRAHAIPEVTSEESSQNLSVLETELNRKMVCFAGKNQVYIRSVILGGGRTSPPRIALKCALRKKYGQEPDVYYDYIRDICCADPSRCAAYREFQKNRPVT